jgi:hypothetical protein
MSGDQRDAFFAQLVRNISILLRQLIVGERDEGSDISVHLAGIAEILHTVSNQMCSDAGLGSAPADEVFLASLLHKGDHWELETSVRWAIVEAARLARPVK